MTTTSAFATSSTNTIAAPGATASAPPLLRWSLLLDAVVTGANGLAYLALSGPIGDLLGVTPGFLVAIGAVLTAFALVLVLISRGRPISSPAVGGAILVNVAWVIASITYVSTVDSLTVVGQVWGIAQAAVVLGFAGLQAYALRARRAATR